MSRLEEIRRRAEAHNAHADLMLPSVMTFVRDVFEVLQEVERLEAENKRLKHRVNRMLTAGMGKDWSDGFEDTGAHEVIH